MAPPGPAVCQHLSKEVLVHLGPLCQHHSGEVLERANTILGRCWHKVCQHRANVRTQALAPLCLTDLHWSCVGSMPQRILSRGEGETPDDQSDRCLLAPKKPKKV